MAVTIDWLNELRVRKQTKICARASGFTLLEMLLVLVVMAVLLALATEGYRATAKAYAVTTGADLLSDALSEARTSAVAQNSAVEVRIYDAAPPSGGAPVYDALQLHWLKADGTTPPVTHPVLLPAWVVIDATAAYSPLIASNPQTAKPDPGDARLNADTRVFHYLPDGSTDLNPATNWFLTVRPAGQPGSAALPSNWACVRVDPATGRPQIYRP
jgi:uncharacterized protein (TIGR02596 family)